MASRKNIDVLKLKILLDDLEQARESHEIGSSMLSQVLLEFKERINENHLLKFNEQFFPSNAVSKKTTSQKQNFNRDKTGEIVLTSNSLELESKPRLKLPIWMKKLYKDIVQRTHPDRFIDFPIEEIKNKYKKVYISAVEAFNGNNPGILLLCAYETEISFEHISEANEIIEKEQEKVKAEIRKISGFLGYQWYHIDEEKKLTVLENYLTSLGYKFDKARAEEAIKKIRIRRKVGTRPEKILRVKRKQIE